MKTIIFLTVLITLTLGQRLAPPRNPPNQPEQGNFFEKNFYPLQADLQLIVKSTCLSLLLLIKYKNLFSGQRCAGRNFNGRRCCTPEDPCDYGEGDCDGPADGGANDGHAGCKGDLVCGSNNCKKFGNYYHEKDDCCDLPETLQNAPPEPQAPIDAPLVPAPGISTL